MESIENSSGITVKELKELIKDLPETDEEGNNFEIWIEHTENKDLSSIVNCVEQLNKGDIILSSETSVDFVHPVKFGRWILRYTNHYWNKDLELCHEFNGEHYTTAELYEEFLKTNL